MSDKKKVAIITLPLIRNIGGNLQAYALATYINSLNYDCTVLNVLRKGHSKWIETKVNVVNFNSSIELINYERLNEFDIFIVGSDIIWRKSGNKNSLPYDLDNPIPGNFFQRDYINIPFLEFTKCLNVNRIAYSASIGSALSTLNNWAYSNEDIQEINTALHNFNAISTRELLLANELKFKFNINACQTVDPTMLLSQAHYLDLCKDIPVRNEAVFCYLLNHKPDKVAIQKQKINEFCLNNNLTYFTQDNLSITSWLAAFRDAKYIITNSFHGVIFSLIFNKPFIAFDDSNPMPQRFFNIETLCELQQNIVRYPYNFTLDNIIKINPHLDFYINESKQYLVNALKLPKTTWHLNQNLNIALCCIAKNENNYIVEWIEHYKKLGFNHIFIYDNNDFDGEDLYDKIKDYIDSGYITYIDVKGKKEYQATAYKNCYNTYGSKYDWIAYFDCDEFLDIDKSTIQEFVSQDKFKDFNSIAFCWKVFTDSNLIKIIDNNYSIKRFTETTIKDSKYVKHIIRGNLSNIRSIGAHSCVIFNNPDMQIKVCNTKGEVVPNENNLTNPTWECGCLNHYMCKTLEEFITFKLFRGYPTKCLNYGKDVTIDRFFRINQITAEKADYIKKQLNIDILNK